MAFSMMAFAGPIPDNTGIVAEDCINGDSYDFDALLKAGKHILIHQAFSG
jgi:hypothetical protein